MQLALLVLAGLAAAHVQMTSPPPFRSAYNNHTTSVDYNMNSPLASSGSDYPCKGYHKLLDTPQGASVATWTAGQNYSMSVEGSATHNGGSCQLSLSYDGGSSWTAFHSFIGGCPLMKTWKFNLPADTPAGEALFAWSWFNQIGNREMYMNCAHITVQPRRQRQAAPVAWASRPKMFVANVNNGCATVEMADVLFPSPGPDVDNVSDNTASPVGTCS
ncbi:uncharacterized protein MAM_04479 [Metarhizium album ARSEF 1941]|uniref:Extracellular protein n=1 Tax=Metarhizium album (strain ARSEF 1941) TaxID=1081103 RepID=A0A0B2WUZ0_METAS|nr:uncharacterized protein MAM_04479 [Metarhizium album ARSEF 1941]KHN97464.1 hypothetical protein MAM_04479 [Metarhizium album ARSEF 1941]